MSSGLSDHREEICLTVVSRNVEATLGGKVSQLTYRVG